jgi:hypothetical protein
MLTAKPCMVSMSAPPATMQLRAATHPKLILPAQRVGMVTQPAGLTRNQASPAGFVFPDQRQSLEFSKGIRGSLSGGY